MEETSDLRRLWSVLRRWYLLILLTTLLAGVSAYVVSTSFMTPEYDARTRLLVQPGSATGTVGYQDVLAGQQVALTYAELLRAERLQEEALQQLALSGGAYQQPLRYNVAVQRLRDTGILELTVSSPDPRLAADLANTIARVFIEDSSERQQARFSASKSALQAQMESVQEDIARTKSQLSTASGEERARLEAQLIQLQDTLAKLNSSYQAVQVAEIQSVDLITVVEAAQVPSRPARPNVLQNTFLAAVVGALLGVGVAFLIEYLDTSVHSAEQAEAVTGTTLLGQIWQTPQLATAPSNGAGPLLLGSHSPAEEAFRVLRANLTFAAVDQPVRTILVTSALPREGKSLVALNLAAALAVAGQRVILLDADLHRAAISRYLGLRHEPGLTEALFDRQGDLRSYLRPVEGVANLWVLPSGALPPNPHEMLTSARMGEVLGRVAGMGDIILLDSPPVLAAADAVVLAARVDGVLLVLEAGRTDARAAAAAAEQLRKGNSRLLGTVLNKVPLSGRRGYGSHYYYYYYYYYSDQDAPRTFWQRLFKRRERRRRRAKTPDEAPEQVSVEQPHD